MRRFEFVKYPDDFDAQDDIALACVNFLGPIQRITHGQFMVKSVIVDWPKELCQIWVVVEDKEIVGVVVTRMIDYPTGRKALVICQFGGEMSDVPMIMTALEKHAKEGGADAMRIEGRVGWSRVLPDYHEISRVIEKELA